MNLESIIETGYLQRGIELYDRGGVLEPTKWKDEIRAEVSEHAVRIELDPVRARCSCPASRRTPFCAHAAATLVAWTRDPKRFRAQRPDAPARRVRRMPIAEGDLVEATRRLAADLAKGGLAAVSDERISSIAELAADLKTAKLTLAPQVSELHSVLARRASVRDYARVYSRLIFALRAGVFREELTELRDLSLVEVAFETRKRGAFLVEESHFVETGAGALFVDRRIRPLARVRDAKRSYRGLDVRRAHVSSGHGPRRIRLREFTECERTVSSEFAVRSVRELYDRYVRWREDATAPPELHALFLSSRFVAAGQALFAADEAADLLPIELDAPRRIAPIVAENRRLLYVAVSESEKGILARIVGAP